MDSTALSVQCCPDCGRPLQTIWDYPANELWCTHCGNRYFATYGPAEGEGMDPLVGFHMLLVDMDGDRRAQLATHFTRLGYRVTPVSHPRQALEAASFRRFELAVMPTQLPEFECSTFVEKLRCLLGQVKVVFIISEADDAMRIARKDSDVVYVAVESDDYCQLEKSVEQLVDELVSAQKQSVETQSRPALVKV